MPVYPGSQAQAQEVDTENNSDISHNLLLMCVRSQIRDEFPQLYETGIISQVHHYCNGVVR